MERTANRYVGNQTIFDEDGNFVGMNPIDRDAQRITRGNPERKPRNGASADLWGVEIAWQQRMTFLPGLLSGVGVFANYPYTTSNAELRGVTREVPLPRQIPHVLNAALSWDRGVS